MMHPKPKKKRKKSRHISNPRITEYVECELCGSAASETHEVFGANNRNKSIRYGAQMKLCKACHLAIHTNYSKEELNALKSQYQKRIMEENDMTTETWITIFGRSWL